MLVKNSEEWRCREIDLGCRELWTYVICMWLSSFNYHTFCHISGQLWSQVSLRAPQFFLYNIFEKFTFTICLSKSFLSKNRGDDESLHFSENFVIFTNWLLKHNFQLYFIWQYLQEMEVFVRFLWNTVCGQWHLFHFRASANFDFLANFHCDASSYFKCQPSDFKL